MLVPSLGVLFDRIVLPSCCGLLPSVCGLPYFSGSRGAFPNQRQSTENLASFDVTSILDWLGALIAHQVRVSTTRVKQRDTLFSFFINRHHFCAIKYRETIGIRLADVNSVTTRRNNQSVWNSIQRLWLLYLVTTEYSQFGVPPEAAPLTTKLQ